MKKNSKIRIFGLLEIVAISIVFLIVGLFLFVDFPNCQGDSSAVSYARSLSKERLDKLYMDMEKYWGLESTPQWGYRIGRDESAVPSVFSDLKVAIVRPKDSNIMVEGCMDEFVYLHFDGFGEVDSPKSIRLSFNTGESAYGTSSEVLWTK